MRHVWAVLDLLSAVMQDNRFMDAYNARMAERRPINMESWIDEAENRGREQGREEGREQGENRILRLMSRLLKDGKKKEMEEVIHNKDMRNELCLFYGIQ